MARDRDLLRQLAERRNRYSAEDGATKLALLAALERTPVVRAARVDELHQHLLFLRAFPDDARVLAAAIRGLGQIAARMRRLPRTERTALDDSGIAGSASRHTFEAPVARWLSERFAPDAEIDWAGVSDSRGLEFLMALVVLRAEQDGLESPGLSARRWLHRAKGASAGTDLAWLVRQLARQRGLHATGFALYDHLEIPVIWRLRDGDGASTRNVLPVRRIVYRRGFRRPPPDAPGLIATRLPRVRRLGRAEAERVLDVTRAALTARCREVYALAHANPAEVHLADLGEGAALAVYGVVPARRLSLESNYGYLLLSNGVPIGYGGVTPLYRQANTGINIFDPFRGSEAAFLWTQMLRTFATLFGVNRFVVNPYQFGAGNSEAIASGAFWFYYRLGFRPVEAGLAALAAAEWQRQQAERGYRTPVATLKRLAGDDLELALPGARAGDRFAERWLGELGLRASEVLAGAGGADRAEDAERVAARVARTLGARGRARWAAAEHEAFTALAPLVSLIDVGSLGTRARSALVALMRLKGAAQEATYVRAAAANPHLLPGLIDVARRLDST